VRAWRRSGTARLDALAGERGLGRTRVVRELLEARLRDRPAPSSEPLTEQELLAILTSRARAGNVSAVRALLLRVERQDPADRWLRELLDDAAAE
jgi:hypothetical protein